MMTVLLAGALGGFIRGMVGFLKYQFAYKNVSFKLTYIVSLMVASSFVGFIITWALVESGLDPELAQKVNPAMAVIIGYAGGDVLENVYKMILGRVTLFPIPKK